MSKKRIALLMAVVMVLGVAVGSTMAWLTDKTGDVVNTFTVGDIDIDLNEHKYDKAEEKLTEQIFGENEARKNDYLFVPGDTLPKDPFVTVEAGSEKCYLFVKVTEANNTCEVTVDNGKVTVDEIIHWNVAPTYIPNDSETSNVVWQRITNKGIENGTEFWYCEVPKSNVNQKWYILEENQITVDTGVIKQMVPLINDDTEETEANKDKPQIIVTAAAVQYDNVETLAAAWKILPFDFSGETSAESIVDPVTTPTNP